MAIEKSLNENLVAEMEDVINQVDGVLSSRIIWAEEEISEVHVLSSKGRNPKQLVRDIETVLQVRGGINVDHKKISIAQVSQGKQSFIRPKLTNVNVESANITAVVRVSIKHEEETFTAEVEGAKSEKNVLRLAAQATLVALEQAISADIRFAVDQVMVMPVEMSQLVSVSVTAVTSAGEDNLLGSAYARGNAREAACKAALDAVNRRLLRLAE
ncbi:hypothetical protein MFMK1_000715 [Metallumcola ferriviriculae]|uniref:Uncharacterized protein n=1 Tax=Metallumcola ferriviriculae TaxID=3039180 RepID=A0AAU0UKU9_9FIRM|nr:hypothetical protein MFMK1_000715 [Desulfitibacteraceae bacterium MK1]